MTERVTIQQVQDMKSRGGKSACLVAWDVHMARIADRVGVELVSVGDTVGVNLWGHDDPLQITMDELLVAAKAARRGVERALLSCDFPFGPLQAGEQETLDAAIRLVKEAGVDLVKLDGAADYPDAVEAVVRAGIPVFAQFGITPQTALRYGVDYRSMAAGAGMVPDELTEELVGQARRLEEAGASLLNFTNSGPTVGGAVVDAVSIPVLGGFGGGPWLDGRIRMATAAVGYASWTLDQPADSYAAVAQVIHDALSECVADIRGARQIRSGRPA